MRTVPDFASSLLRAAIVLALAAQTLAAQTERVDAAMNARIRDEGSKRSQVLATARMLSDGFGPRLSGAPGYTAAARWAVTAMGSRYPRVAVLRPRRSGRSARSRRAGSTTGQNRFSRRPPSTRTSWATV